MKKSVCSFVLTVGLMFGTQLHGFWDVVGAVADALYEQQYDSIVYEVQDQFREINREMSYFSSRFGSYHQRQLYDIQELLRFVTYEWLPFVNEYERFNGLVMSDVIAVSQELDNLYYALAMARISPTRFYDAELGMIHGILRSLWYEMERPATSPYALVHCAEWISEITHIVTFM